jgi:hypothetical protein
MLIRNSNLNLAIPTMNRGGYGLGIPREGLYMFLRYANYDTGSGIWYDDLDFKSVAHNAYSVNTGTGSATLTDSGSYGWKFTPADPWGQDVKGRGQKLDLDTTDWSAPSGSTIIFTMSPNWELVTPTGPGQGQNVWYCPCQETQLQLGTGIPQYKVMALFDQPETQVLDMDPVGESRIILNDVLQNPTPLVPRPTLSQDYTRPGYFTNLQTVGASNIVVAQKSALTNSFLQFGSPRFTYRGNINPVCYRYYDGALRDVLIYNRQLTDVEIATITSLLAYYATQPENWTRHFG